MCVGNDPSRTYTKHFGCVSVCVGGEREREREGHKGVGTMSLNAVQGQQGGKDGERTRLFPASATGYSNGQSASPTDIEQQQPSRSGLDYTHRLFLSRSLSRYGPLLSRLLFSLCLEGLMWESIPLGEGEGCAEETAYTCIMRTCTPRLF